MNLTQQQFIELKTFLGTSPEDYGEWRIIPSCKFPTCVNSLGTMVIRFACSYVTSDGQHRNMDTKSYVFSNMGNGYLGCGYGGIHQLVAEAFLDTWNPDLQVNHIDGNKHNNCVNNLEMVTSLENIHHFLNADCFIDARKAWKQNITQGLADYYDKNDSVILGKKWVHKGVDSILIFSSEMESYLSQGYELGPYISEEHHQKLVAHNIGNSYAKGAVRSQKFKDNLAKRMKGNTFSLGYHHSEESKKRISDAKRGIPKSMETRRKLSEAKKGKPQGPMSEECKAKIAEFRRGKIWVHSGTTGEMRQVTSEQLDEFLNNGFVRGMK